MHPVFATVMLTSWTGRAFGINVEAVGAEFQGGGVAAAGALAVRGLAGEAAAHCVFWWVFGVVKIRDVV
jgi:hypothetical protein